MGATIFFATCNFFIGELSDMGAGSLEYYCTGSLLISILYFIKQREWRKKNLEQRGLLD